MKTYLPLFVGLSLIACSSSKKDSTKLALEEYPKEYRDFVFKNAQEPLDGLRVIEYEAPQSGLKVLLIPREGTGVIAYVTAFDVGSRFESAGRTGLAHLFEHMMFRGTPSFPEPFKTLSGWGQRYNAYTSFDLTLYHELVPKNLFEDVVKFESERMRKLRITEDMFKTERGAVVSERKMRTEDSPFGRLYWELHQLAFDKHPYKTGPIGWQEDLDATTYQDALDFYQRFYAPNRAHIVIAGDFHIREALNHLSDHYGDYKREPWEDPKIPKENLKRSNRRSVIPMQAESVYMADARFSPAAKEPATLLESFMCSLLAGGAGYLDFELVEKKIAQSVSSSCSPSIDPGLSSIFLVANPGVSYTRLEQAYDQALNGFASWLNEDRVEGLKLYYIKSQLESLRDPMSLAEQVGYTSIVHQDPIYGFKALEEIKKITLSDVQKMWAEWRKRVRTRVILNPAKESAPFKKPSGSNR